tara:strand:+ start:16602 stop:16790 length:189 start_codon:yes stop_codon:yes gene_type:complete
MAELEFLLWVVLCAGIYMLLRNRYHHALYQKQKEELWRQILLKVEKQRKIDELYGRTRDRED